MPEVLRVNLDDDGTYDKVLQDSLQDSGDLQIIIKNNCTNNGRACAMLTFTVDVNGKLHRAQTVMTMRNLMGALRILESHYTDDGNPRGKKN